MFSNPHFNFTRQNKQRASVNTEDRPSYIAIVRRDFSIRNFKQEENLNILTRKKFFHLIINHYNVIYNFLNLFSNRMLIF